MVWAAAVNFYNQYNMLPPSEMLASTVVSQLRMESDFSQQTVDESVAFMEWAYPPEFPDDQLVPSYAIDLIRNFLVERRVAAELQSAFQAGIPSDNAAVPALVETAYQQMQRIGSIQAYDRGEQIPAAWEEVAAPTIPTGVPIIDRKMSGGTEPREVHVILGPTGVGKTTLGMQIVCSMARQNFTDVTDRVDDATRKLHVFLSYEDEKRSMVVRSLAFSARIDKTTLEHMGSYNELSRRGNLNPYERQMFEDDVHGNPPGEYERMLEAREWINSYCEFGDFSGRRAAGEAVRGYGGMAEIRQYLDMVTNATGLPLGVVAIDWAGRCVRRYISDIQRQQTALMSEFVGDAFDQVSSAFNCPVFIMHQLKGATGSSPTKKLTHHDAEGCSTFAVNAWFAFVLGNKDENTNTCLFQVTKTRRGESDTGQICLINGRFSEIIEADSRYKIDRLTNRIVLRSEADRVADGDDGQPDAGGALQHGGPGSVDQDYLDD
jgi:RecA/RadA recombinase